MAAFNHSIHPSNHSIASNSVAHSHTGAAAGAAGRSGRNRVGVMAANGPSSSAAAAEEHALEQPWQLYLHYPTFTQSIESYASEAYQVLWM